MITPILMIVGRFPQPKSAVEVDISSSFLVCGMKYDNHVSLWSKYEVLKSILSSNSFLHDVFCMRLMLYNDSDTLLKMAFDTVGNVLQFISLKS